jgi:voltage-gated potassium channel Kch
VRRAWLLLAAAGGCVAVGADCFSAAEHISYVSGLYWAVTTATTVGYGDVIPRNTVGQLIAIAVMLTTIPLLASVFALITGAHMAAWWRARPGKRLHADLDEIRETAQKAHKIAADLHEHVTGHVHELAPGQDKEAHR